MSIPVINTSEMCGEDPQELVQKYQAKGIPASSCTRHNQSRPDDEMLIIGTNIPFPVHHGVKSYNGFTVGDRVRLNRSGLEVCQGLTTPEQIKAQVEGVRLLEIYPHNNGTGICGVELEEPLDFFLDLQDIERV